MNTLTYGKINAFWLMAAAVIVMPDIVFGLLAGLLHLVFELAHLAFELFESALDHLVEHIFHTGTKATQIIVFYTMITMSLVAGFFLWSWVRRLSQKLKEALQLALFQQHQRFLMFWAESATNKFKLVAGFNVALTVAYLTSF